MTPYGSIHPAPHEPRVQPLSDATGSLVRLPDGRRIGVRETGDPRGWPLLVFPGIPCSRLTPLPDVAATGEAGARAIVLERPGFGMSSPQPGRRIVDWPADVARVADAMGIDSFAIAGMSGAGPYLAACAIALPRRVRSVGMLGVVCPLDAPGVRRSMTLRRRLMYGVLPLAPYAVPLLRLLGPRGVQRVMSADVPDCDKAILARIAEPYAAMKRESFRQGPTAFATELALAAGPWGFRLEDIRVPVHLWHGELDVSTPVAMGRYLAATIPGCHATFVSAEGHFVAYAKWAEILAALAPR
jgi:pimeloyl-ACP methyl ester carboxylesterase